MQTTHAVGTWHAWLNGNGTEVMQQNFVTEQDTFSGPNGTPFVSDPYRYTYHFAWDSTGTPTEWVVTGTILRVTLPDGTVFRSTGRANVLPTDGFALVPDTGHAGNLAAFCAALD